MWRSVLCLRTFRSFKMGILSFVFLRGWSIINGIKRVLRSDGKKLHYGTR
jgi:hypothetical protein